MPQNSARFRISRRSYAKTASLSDLRFRVATKYKIRTYDPIRVKDVLYH